MTSELTADGHQLLQKDLVRQILEQEDLVRVIDDRVVSLEVERAKLAAQREVAKATIKILDRRRLALENRAAVGGTEGRSTRETIKKAIIHVLRDYDWPISSDALHREVCTRMGRADLARTSFSPQLSRLVAAGKVQVVVNTGENLYQLPGPTATAG